MVLSDCIGNVPTTKNAHAEFMALILLCKMPPPHYPAIIIMDSKSEYTWYHTLHDMNKYHSAAITMSHCSRGLKRSSRTDATLDNKTAAWTSGGRWASSKPNSQSSNIQLNCTTVVLPKWRFSRPLAAKPMGATPTQNNSHVLLPPKTNQKFHQELQKLI